jgi:hypothetical protein
LENLIKYGTLEQRKNEYLKKFPRHKNRKNHYRAFYVIFGVHPEYHEHLSAYTEHIMSKHKKIKI